MTSITDRLLARLITAVECNMDVPLEQAAEEVLQWAGAERLALAEQQSAPALATKALPEKTPWICPTCNGRKKLVYPSGDPRWPDMSEKPCPSCQIIPQNYAPAPSEPPRADWIEDARHEAHAAFRRIGSLNEALDAFIAAMPKGVCMTHTPLSEPQPDEVPAELLYRIRAQRHIPAMSPKEIAEIVWNAARRYAPYPPKVTPEMLSAAIEKGAGFFDNFDGGFAKAILEAALSATPQQKAK